MTPSTPTDFLLLPTPTTSHLPPPARFLSLPRSTTTARRRRQTRAASLQTDRGKTVQSTPTRTCETWAWHRMWRWWRHQLRARVTSRCSRRRLLVPTKRKMTSRAMATRRWRHQKMTCGCNNQFQHNDFCSEYIIVCDQFSTIFRLSFLVHSVMYIELGFLCSCLGSYNRCTIRVIQKLARIIHSPHNLLGFHSFEMILHAADE